MSAVLEAQWAVRLMQTADLPEVLDIERASYEFPWSQGIFEDCLAAGYACFVLQEGQAGIGAYALMSVSVGEAHLLNLCVAPACRRTGMAAYLLERMLLIAQQEEAYVMFLEVRPSNRAALELYRQMGFSRIGRRRNYYPAPGGREDAVILSRDIDE